MTRISPIDLARDLPQVLAAVCDGERVFVKQGNKDLAVLLPFDQWEDIVDSLDANRALADLESGAERTIPWETVKAQWESRPMSPRRGGLAKKRTPARGRTTARGMANDL